MAAFKTSNTSWYLERIHLYTLQLPIPQGLSHRRQGHCLDSRLSSIVCGYPCASGSRTRHCQPSTSWPPSKTAFKSIRRQAIKSGSNSWQRCISLSKFHSWVVEKRLSVVVESRNPSLWSNSNGMFCICICRRAPKTCQFLDLKFPSKPDCISLTLRHRWSFVAGMDYVYIHPSSIRESSIQHNRNFDA